MNAFLSYSAKTKRDGRKDRQTDGWGVLQYLPSRALGAAGDNKVISGHYWPQFTQKLDQNQN